MTKTLVSNLLTMSVFEYSYAFNSYAKIGDTYYAAGPTGLVQIDVGNLDITTPIAAKITTGEEDFGVAEMKRISDVYLTMRASDNVLIRIYPDEQAPYEYLIQPLAVDTIMQRRALIGKGMRARHWLFDIENTNGGELEINELTVSASTTARRL